MTFNNNFNSLRILAASLVVFSHSYALSIHPDAQPLWRDFQTTFGKIAVDIFFFASGYLVYGSLQRSKTNLRYVLSRLVRIYPLLIVTILLTALIIGPITSKNTLVEYLQQLQVYKYILLNSTLIGLSDSLPGVFEKNPFPESVNGVIWTLYLEVRLYFILLGFHIFNKASKRFLPFLKFKNSFTTILIILSFISICIYYHQDNINWRLSFLFFMGVIFKEKSISIRSNLLLILSLATIIVTSILNPNYLDDVIFLSIPIIIHSLAFMNLGLLSRLNNIGDPSYGLYLFHFPIQQTILNEFNSFINAPIPLFIVSFVIATGIAFLSYNYFEKPILSIKEDLAANINNFIRNLKIYENRSNNGIKE